VTAAIFDVAWRATAARDVDVDLRRARVEAVFEQLLQRRGRTLDDLAGSDLIDQEIG